MRIYFSLLIWCCYCCTLLALSDTIPHYVIRSGVEERIKLANEVELLLDPEGVNTIETILDSLNHEFSKKENPTTPQSPFLVWSRIRLSNQGPRSELLYFSLCNYVDSAWVYHVDNGKVITETLSGAKLKLFDKALPSLQSFISFSLDPGESKTYYFKLLFNKQVESVHLRHIYILPGQSMVNTFIRRFAWHSFYAGLIVLFCLVSVFMYWMFRERVFIYFALLMLFFALYFLTIHDITYAFFMSGFRNENMTINHIIISGLLLSAFLFVSRYLDLRKQRPVLYRFYLYYTLFAVSLSHALSIVLKDEALVAYINNLGMLPWVLLTMVAIILQAWKKDKSSRIMLISIVVLFIGVLFFIMGLIEVIPKSKITENGFQIGSILFSGILFYGLFDKINTIRNEKQKMEQLDKMKSRFFANISHEFRTPLTLITGPIREVMEKVQDAKDKSLLQMAHRNARRLLQLINQLLDLSKLESGKMDLCPQKLNFASLLKGIVMSFESLAARKEIRLHFVSQKEEIPLIVDRDMIEKIFYNLLSNAFKFTPEQGEISVMVTEQDTEVEVIVRDNGIGIPAERIAYIFNRFYQIDKSETRENEGAGIGLALVKELITLHSGTISVQSKEGKGTVFTICFPKGALAETGKPEMEDGNTPEVDVELFYEPESVIENTIPLSVTHLEKMPEVLIIEDNADVRNYIKQHLVSSFSILEATNGRTGIETAFEHLPDLVISDVMMPEKNGYEVCEVLKTDQRTSHIPVILLTAKAAHEEKIKGLETGADDYLLKPFDTRELEVRIRNLIHLRQKLRKRFSESGIIDLKAAGTNAVDKAFLEKVLQTVEANLSDEKFSVETLARASGMSRVHLNRKLKALIDQSANKFIQAFRLEKAYEMLKQKSGNVSEIAFQTGFSSTAYFVKCFREKYGKTPGTVLQE